MSENNGNLPTESKLSDLNFAIVNYRLIDDIYSVLIHFMEIGVRGGLP